jgi:restriction system protein
MTSYYRVMLGRKSMHAEECLAGNFIGADFGMHRDLTKDLVDNWREFNKRFVPVYLEKNPSKSKIAAGLSCGALWTVSHGIKQSDVVLCPDGKGSYRVGDITGDYHYVPNALLPHRRTVTWRNQTVSRSAMSEPLRNSTGSIGTVCNITKHQQELTELLGKAQLPPLVATDPTIENASTFALEAHLEHFLYENWAQTDLAKDLDIYQDDEESGRQLQTDTGPLDILAISKDKKRLVVIELKKGRASDAVVGQVLRYMGFVKDQLADEGQTVEGIIIAHEDDKRLRRALEMTPAVSFYRYKVSFQLITD